MNAAQTTNLPFKPFDEKAELDVYYNGFLPHWRQAGGTYFVTWRLADSIPTAVLEAWQEEKRKWLDHRGIDPQAGNWLQLFKQLPAIDRQSFERHFVSIFFANLDEGHGECLLREARLANEVMNAICFFHGQRLDVGDVVIMPNHVHALLTPYDGSPLEKILHSIKSYSSNAIQRSRKTTGTLWMGETYDRLVRDSEELFQTQKYIRNNPSKAKLAAGSFLLHTAEYELKSD